jgi:hypothetical protein
VIDFGNIGDVEVLCNLSRFESVRVTFPATFPSYVAILKKIDVVRGSSNIQLKFCVDGVYNSVQSSPTSAP